MYKMCSLTYQDWLTALNNSTDERCLCPSKPPAASTSPLPSPASPNAPRANDMLPGCVCV